MFNQLEKDGRSSRRRMSVEDSMAKLVYRIRDTMDRLTELWDEVHMDQSSRESRVEYAYLHFYTLLDDIIKSEEDMVNGVKSDIEVRRLAIADLREMLKMPDFHESAYPANSIAMLKALDKELHQMTKRRDEAIEVQLNEYELMRELCARLNTEPLFSCAEVKSKVFSPCSLQSLKSKRKSLAADVEKRVENMTKLQADCRRMYKALKETLSYSAEQQNLLNTEFSSSSAQISDEVMENLEKLHTFMSDAYVVWLDQASFQYSEALIALHNAADKCGVEEIHLIYPDFFDPETQDQSSIDKMEVETKRYELRYEHGEQVFQAFIKWRTFWREKLNREQESCSLHFYNNRGGQLSAFLKRQKQLNILVPQALEALKNATRKFLDEGGDSNDILIEEILPDEYAEFLESEHKEQKELHKTLKAINQNNTQSAPFRGNRRISGRTKVTASKLARRKLSIGHRHKLSNISPMRVPTGGLKTSSPKLLSSPAYRTPLKPTSTVSKTGLTPAESGKILSGSVRSTQTQLRSRLPLPASGLALFARSAPRVCVGVETPRTSFARGARTPLRQLDVNFYSSAGNVKPQQNRTPVNSHWRY